MKAAGCCAHNINSLRHSQLHISHVEHQALPHKSLPTCPFSHGRSTLIHSRGPPACNFLPFGRNILEKLLTQPSSPSPDSLRKRLVLEEDEEQMSDGSTETALVTTLPQSAADEVSLEPSSDTDHSSNSTTPPPLKQQISLSPYAVFIALFVEYMTQDVKNPAFRPLGSQQMTKLSIACNLWERLPNKDKLVFYAAFSPLCASMNLEMGITQGLVAQLLPRARAHGASLAPNIKGPLNEALLRAMELRAQGVATASATASATAMAHSMQQSALAERDSDSEESTTMNSLSTVELLPSSLPPAEALSKDSVSSLEIQRAASTALDPEPMQPSATEDKTQVHQHREGRSTPNGEGELKGGELPRCPPLLDELREPSQLKTSEGTRQMESSEETTCSQLSTGREEFNALEQEHLAQMAADELDRPALKLALTAAGHADSALSLSYEPVTGPRPLLSGHFSAPEVSLVTSLRPQSQRQQQQMFWGDFMGKCRQAWDVFFPSGSSGHPKALSPAGAMRSRLQMILVSDRSGLDLPTLMRIKNRSMAMLAESEGWEALSEMELQVASQKSNGERIKVRLPLSQMPNASMLRDMEEYDYEYYDDDDYFEEDDGKISEIAEGTRQLTGDGPSHLRSRLEASKASVKEDPDSILLTTSQDLVSEKLLF